MATGDGEKIEGNQCCPGVKVAIHRNILETDLLVVPMGDSQVIVGTVWLKILGPSLWDFNRRTHNFGGRENLSHCMGSNQEMWML